MMRTKSSKDLTALEPRKNSGRDIRDAVMKDAGKQAARTEA